NVAMGLAQVGMLEQTRFTLKYLRTETLRRQVQSSLNNGEAVNSLARALFFGRRGGMRDRAFADQMHRASCLVVVIAAIAAWNDAASSLAYIFPKKIDVPCMHAIAGASFPCCTSTSPSLQLMSASVRRSPISRAMASA